MALTVALGLKAVPGSFARTVTNVTGDASYPTGGYTITPQQLGFSSLIRSITSIDAANFASAALVPVLTPTFVGGVITSVQFQLQNYATATEVANTTNVSAFTFVITAEGN